ncbi:CLL_collapsed_G0029360.mRNA.1.CDS.1 [Saccharomyces cerevisiae]|nr:CLL_collapsed_G0029360.mRNA.1.CDS.1 [Saccharomyces cerevisiae]
MACHLVNPPTVTLPRLKSITTGSTPSFIDLLLNVAQDIDSNDLSEHDSWLQQFIQHNNTIRFMGDDTWLKLFPQQWFPISAESDTLVLCQ